MFPYQYVSLCANLLLEGLGKQRLERMYLFFRKLESSRILREAPHTGDGCFWKAPEGMILRDMLELPSLKCHIYHIRMPHASFKLSPRIIAFFFILLSISSKFFSSVNSNWNPAGKQARKSNFQSFRTFDTEGILECWNETVYQIKNLDTSYNYIVFFPPVFL